MYFAHLSPLLLHIIYRYLLGLCLHHSCRQDYSCPRRKSPDSSNFLSFVSHCGVIWMTWTFWMKLNPVHPVNEMQLNAINQWKGEKSKGRLTHQALKCSGWAEAQLTTAALAKGAGNIWQSDRAVTLTHNVQNHSSIIPTVFLSAPIIPLFL